MAQAAVVLRRAGEDERVMLAPGDVIGRSQAAALCLDDPRVSEAHAMVSLRERALKLIGLRGWLRHDGDVTQELTLCVGARVEFAPGVELVCEDVSLPDHLVGLELPGGLVVTLVKTMTLKVEAGKPTLRGGFDADGDANFWSIGAQWRVRRRGGEPEALTPGQTVTVRGVELRVVEVPLAAGSRTQTRSQMRLPLTLTRSGGRVRVQYPGAEPVLISGIPGKILSSAIGRGLSASWEEVIADVWPDDVSTRAALRYRFDAGLSRLRDALRHALPDHDDLLSMDGTGVLVVRLSDDDPLEFEP